MRIVSGMEVREQEMLLVVSSLKKLQEFCKLCARKQGQRPVCILSVVSYWERQLPESEGDPEGANSWRLSQAGGWTALPQDEKSPSLKVYPGGTALYLPHQAPL